jgi:hypothetical protein
MAPKQQVNRHFSMESEMRKLNWVQFCLFVCLFVLCVCGCACLRVESVSIRIT